MCITSFKAVHLSDISYFIKNRNINLRSNKTAKVMRKHSKGNGQSVLSFYEDISLKTR